MKKNNRSKYALVILASVLALSILAGCVSPVAGTGANGTPKQYAVNTNALQAFADTAHGVIAATAPVNPYAIPMNMALDGGLAVAAAISALFAAIKNKQAANANAATATMAQAVVAQGPTVASAVVDHASYTPQFAAVASHINDATPAQPNK